MYLPRMIYKHPSGKLYFEHWPLELKDSEIDFDWEGEYYLTISHDEGVDRHKVREIRESYPPIQREGGMIVSYTNVDDEDDCLTTSEVLKAFLESGAQVDEE